MTAPEREALVKARVYVNVAATMMTYSETSYQFAQSAKDLLGEIDAALSAPAVTVTEGWKPIKSAPKDNAKVLIYVPPERIKGTDYPAIVMVSRFKGYWWDAGHLKPTHWQPLPPPPSTAPQTGSQE